MMPIYILICLVFTLFYMEKRTLEHFLFCFIACFSVTPLFGKKLYVWIMKYDIEQIRREKKLHREAKASGKKELGRYYQTLIDEGLADEKDLRRMIDEMDLDALEKLEREYQESKKRRRPEPKSDFRR